MNDVPSMPGVDEPAKAVAEVGRLGQRVADLLEGGGQWVSDVLGDLPRDLVGYIAGDRLKLRRLEAWAELEARRQKLLRDRGLDPQQLEQPSRNILLPILNASKDEQRSEMKDLWARLLAAASDPSRRVRLFYIEAIDRMEPEDAKLLLRLGERVGKNADEWWQFDREGDADVDDYGTFASLVVSATNLSAIGFVDLPHNRRETISIDLIALGKAFLAAVSD